LVGTFWLVLGGCGAAVLASNFMPTTNLGIGLVGVSLAFGLTVVTGAYALGHISGGHFNPAVTLGLVAGRRFPAKEALGYVVAQVIGAILASAVLAVIANGVPAFNLKASGFAANGFANHSPGGYNATSSFVCEVVMTFMFLVVIMGATAKRGTPAQAGLTIGLALTLIHLISIPVTNTSVNPARSTGPALFVGGWALSQLWMFWVAPLIGGILGGLAYHFLNAEKKEAPATQASDPTVATTPSSDPAV
jgi:aquaporin Z